MWMRGIGNRKPGVGERGKSICTTKAEGAVLSAHREQSLLADKRIIYIISNPDYSVSHHLLTKVSFPRRASPVTHS